MKTPVSIDAVIFELVESTDSPNLAQDSVKQFSSRYEIEQFVDKALVYDASSLQHLVDDSSIDSTQVAELARHLTEKIEQGDLLVQQPADGAAAPGAVSPSSSSLDFQPSVSTEGISDRYSPDMKKYIATHRDNYQAYGGIKPEFLASSDMAQAIGTNGQSPRKLTPSEISSSKPASLQQASTQQASTQHGLLQAQEDSLNYKITVEVAGRNACPKQQIEISALASGAGVSPGEQAQTMRARHHARDRHRSVVEYRKIPNVARDITLTIPIKGYGPYIRLPLQTGVAPSNINTDKAEWDNILIPVKPLAYVTKNQIPQEADILKPGWLYIFWRGQLWRELEVRKNQAFRDVRVAYYRQSASNAASQDVEREAEGHWLSSVWLPYKLNNEYQTGANAPRIAFSEEQYDWSYITSLEQSADKLAACSTELDFSAYSKDQHFNDVRGDMGSIETALLDQLIDTEATGYSVISERGKQLRSMRDSRIPVVFLPTAKDKFLLCVKDKKGKVLRNKTLTFDIGNRSITQTTDHAGMIEVAVEENDSWTGDLSISNASGKTHQGSFQVKTGKLAAVSTVEGQQARLNNLGWNAGVVDGINGKKTKSALKRFQSAFALEVDGICGPISQKKLKQVYNQ